MGWDPWIIMSVFTLTLLTITSAAADEAKRTLAFPDFDSPALSDPFSSIVNGVVTADYPAVGALLLLKDNGTIGNACTGAFVGCHWFLTAAHCLVGRQGTSGSSMRIFTHQLGFSKVKSFKRFDDYRDCTDGSDGICSSGDLALVETESDIEDIEPLPVGRTQDVLINSNGEIVGFGITKASRVDFGIKRRGPVKIVQCPTSSSPVPESSDIKWVCWRYDGLNGADTCRGDSGGPYIINNGAIGGVTATGVPLKDHGACSDEIAFDTRVHYVHYSRWIDRTTGLHTSPGLCPNAKGVSAAISKALVLDESYLPSVDQDDQKKNANEVTIDLNLPTDVLSLRIALAGSGTKYSTVSAVHLSALSPDPAAQTSSNSICAPTVISNIAYCEIKSPQPGKWKIVLSFIDSNAHDPTNKFVFQIVATIVRKSS